MPSTHPFGNMWRSAPIVLALFAIGCGDDGGPAPADDAGDPDGGLDAAPPDAGEDAGEDAAPEDASTHDSGPCEPDVDRDGFCGGVDGTDCDDDDPLVHPGAEDPCDGTDRDCDGRPDTGCTWHFGRPSPVVGVHVSPGPHASPWLGADGLRLYYVTSDMPWIASRPSADDPFGAPTALEGEDLAAYCIGSVTVSSDELEMFVHASPRPECTDVAIYRATREEAALPFGALALVETVNDPDPEVADLDPALSSDGLQLLFASDRTGARRIWSARRDDAGSAFGVPNRLELLGDSDADASPFLHDDGHTIFFERRIAGTQRIMRAVREAPDDLAFGRPIEMVDLAVEGARDGQPVVARATGEIFFATDRPWSPAAPSLWRAQVCRRVPCDEPVVECPEEGVRSPDGRTCWVFDATLSTFDEAVTRCADAGGHLATIHSSDENLAVRDVAGDEATAWIGSDDRDEEGSFVWITGEPLLFTSWGGGEPNDCCSGVDGEENCAVIRADSTWNDAACDLTLPSVCETELWPWW